MGTVTGYTDPLRLAIVGGGFTGAALAIHALTSATQPLSVDVIEPSAKLGRGAAYGTTIIASTCQAIECPCSVPIRLTSRAGSSTRNGCRTTKALTLLDAASSQETRLRPTQKMFSHKQCEALRQPRCVTVERGP